MFTFKKKYFFIIENIKDINLRNIKKRDKFNIIYRNTGKTDKLDNLIKFRKKCKLKRIKFFVANNIVLGINLKSDGIYISAHNKNLNSLNLKRFNFEIIGSAHNHKEIVLKKLQGCKYIFLSKLFMVDYKKKERYLGVTKFNRYSHTYQNKMIPLGGIKTSNLNKLKNVCSEGFAILTEVKKKPAIFDRLF